LTDISNNITYYEIFLPDDVNLEASLQRYDHDTKIGTLTEIWIPIKKVVNYQEQLKAPRFKNFMIDTVTSEKLHSEDEPEGK
jgi:hypothetical protein